MKSLTEIPGLHATLLRIPPQKRDSSKHYYNCRHDDDDWATPVTLEKYVLVNHCMTVVSPEPIELDEDGSRVLTENEQTLLMELCQ
jgi:hypothetical protein